MLVHLLPLTVENFDSVVTERSPVLPTQKHLIHEEQMRTVETLLHRVAAVTPTGRMVGYGRAVTGPWDPTPKPLHFEIRVQVDPEWTRRGVGDAIFRELERFALEHGAVALESSVLDSEPGDLAWAEHRGFKQVQHVFASELDLTQWNPHQVDGAADKARAAGVRFASLAEYPATDEWFQRFANLYWELAEDVPGMAGRTPTDLSEWKQTFATYWDPAAVILAVADERWVAMAFNLKLPDRGYYNNMTGVTREYRGRGLGLAVKTKAVEYALSQGARYMRTHNDSTNLPMLGVNARLGFRPLRGTFWLLRSL